MIGLVDRERVDTKLYDDYETEKAREVSVLLAMFLSVFNLISIILEKNISNLVLRLGVWCCYICKVSSVSICS